MSPIFVWGIEFIRSLQEIVGPGAVGVAQFFTFIGNQEFYLLLFPLFFWCLDRLLGARLAIVYLLSVVLNTNLKDLIMQPRPYVHAPEVAAVDPAGEFNYGTGYGMPSGHAQWSLTIWVMIAAWVRKRWFWGFTLLLTLLIALSRLILGVHFPTQVLAGWGFALLVLGAYFFLTAPLENWLRAQSEWVQLLLGVLIAFGLLFIYPAEDVVAATAVLLGLFTGLVLAARFAPFSVAGSWQQRVARYFVGIIVLLLIYFGLSAVFPGEGEPLHTLLRFLRYALLGLWISLGAPWLFRRLNLADGA